MAYEDIYQCNSITKWNGQKLKNGMKQKLDKCTCACLCVCVWEKKRETDGEREKNAPCKCCHLPTLRCSNLHVVITVALATHAAPHHQVRVRSRPIEKCRTPVRRREKVQNTPSQSWPQHMHTTVLHPSDALQNPPINDTTVYNSLFPSPASPLPIPSHPSNDRSIRYSDCTTKHALLPPRWVMNDTSPVSYYELWRQQSQEIAANIASVLYDTRKNVGATDKDCKINGRFVMDIYIAAAVVVIVVVTATSRHSNTQ